MEEMDSLPHEAVTSLMFWLLHDGSLILVYEAGTVWNVISIYFILHDFGDRGWMIDWSQAFEVAADVQGSRGLLLVHPFTCEHA